MTKIQDESSLGTATRESGDGPAPVAAFLPIATCWVLTKPLEERRRILVYGEMGMAMGYVIDYGDGTRHVAAEGFHGSWKITHWMPLPAPPIDEATSRG